MFVINALLLVMVGSLLEPGFRVDGFWPAFKGGIVISVVSWVLGVVTGTSKMKVKVGGVGGTQKKQPRRGIDDKDDGGGPVIDV
jgi:putative membrane protein